MLKKLVGLAAATVFATTAAQAGVVVKSSGPSAAKYKVGDKVDDNGTITLQAGDSVTVVTARGTRVLTGPGTMRVGASGESRRSTFATLTRQRSGARARTGAVRGTKTDEASANPNLWNLDVATGGKMCVADAGLLNVWRPSVASEETYVFGKADSDFHVHVTFDEGVSQASLSGEEMPLVDGGAYTISGPDGAPAKTFDLVVLDEVPRSMDDMAAVLATSGCTAQLDMLAEKVMLAN